MDSILTSIKKLLGIDESDTDFDMDVIIHINSALSILHQLGVGPTSGFAVMDASALWSDFISSDHSNLEDVKTYIYLKVKLVFDPGQLSSAVITAMKEEIKELEWRLNVAVETPIEEEEIQNG